MAPSEVLVEVLNGNGWGGLAAQTAGTLRGDGFLINGTGNAATFTNPVTLVLYPPGMEEQAATLAAYVSGGIQVEASTAVPEGVVHLVLGESFRGVTATEGGG